MKIAISGKAGSGKTALAKILINKYGFKHVSFAKKVKDTAIVVYDLSYEEAHGANKNRELLQRLGQGLRETISYNVWTDAVKNEINNLEDENIVIDDVRYKNEYNMLADDGFIMVRLVTPETIRRERIPNTFPQNPSHISEIDLDDIPSSKWDVVIGNVEGLDYLDKCADNIFNSFKKESDNV